jgi:hypothetical protein
MRRTRAAYHYAILKLKREEGKLVNERLVDSMLTDNTRDFWSEVKRIRSNKCGTSRIVDGQTDGLSIAEVFADKYKDLCTSVPYNTNEFNCIQAEVNELLLAKERYIIVFRLFLQL